MRGTLCLVGVICLAGAAVHAQDAPSSTQATQTATADQATQTTPSTQAAQTTTPAQAAQTGGVEARVSYKFGLDYMMHFASRHEFPYPDDSFQGQETFMWERLRPRLVVRTPHVDFLLEGQDTHSVGSVFTTRTAWLDLLGANAEFKNMKGWGVKVGRVQGDLEVIPRMVGTPNFAAVIRSFDLAEVSWQKNRIELRAFVFAPIDNFPTQFNHRHPGEMLWTTFARTHIGKQEAQTYVVARRQTVGQLVSETGVAGNGTTYTWEMLGTGPTVVPKLAWFAETAVQRGHWSTDAVQAWAVFLRADYKLPNEHDVSVGFNQLSGDAVKGDGTHGVFDTYYGASNQYGSLGMNRGPNLRQFLLSSNFKLARPAILTLRYYNDHLVERADAWYLSATPNVYRPTATSSHLGDEVDVTLSYRVIPAMTVRTSAMKFFPGAYLKTGPYGGPWEVRAQILGSF